MGSHQQSRWYLLAHGALPGFGLCISPGDPIASRFLDSRWPRLVAPPRHVRATALKSRFAPIFRRRLAVAAKIPGMGARGRTVTLALMRVWRQKAAGKGCACARGKDGMGAVGRAGDADGDGRGQVCVASTGIGSHGSFCGAIMFCQAAGSDRRVAGNYSENIATVHAIPPGPSVRSGMGRRARPISRAGGTMWCGRARPSAIRGSTEATIRR